MAGAPLPSRFSLTLLFGIIGGLWLPACLSDKPSREEVEELVPISPEEEAKEVVRRLYLPESPYPYSELSLPTYMTEQVVIDGFVDMSIVGEDNLPDDNPITDEGATLGRVLFYDRNLSANGSVACASCHVQRHGFSDPRKLSIGLHGERTRRHAMSLVNARYYRRGRFFWDERAVSLEEQVLLPFFDPIEMGLEPDSLLDVVARIPYYADLFEQAFGNPEPSLDRLSSALSQFIRSIVSYRSKYDKGREQVNSSLTDFPNFNERENLGKRLFFQPRSEGFSCFECHATEGFVATPLGPQNNGLDASFGKDLGVFETFSSRPDLRGSFKIPTLRNIAVTAPYMHDGRFRTLMDVVNHYNEGVQPHPELSPFMKGANGRPFQLGLDEQEKQALVDFLHTLTDRELNGDPMFSDPFVD